jgi:uncharacterized protein YcbK (DUF882 family)
MGDLSTHFSSREFACHCDQCEEQIPVVSPELIDALEALRRIVARPLFILSGYRCPAHNAAIGSTPTSQHVQGRAADLQPPPGWSPRALHEAAEKVPAFARGGIGLYAGFVHVDVRPNGPARWNG